jgi:hypothetical protein
VKRFQHLVGPKPELKKIVYSDSRLKKKIFQFFEPFCARLASKLAKSANLTPKIFFSQHFLI